MADNSTPKVGQEVRLLVNATEPIDNIVYEVMGRGDIVLARSVPVSKDSTTHEFVFTATHRMAPKARVVVYYVRPVNQEVVADAINFDIDGIFRTPCTVSASESQTKPGANVDIRVDTKAGAYVGLLGLDQSILLLKTGNDITQHDVMNELDMYDGGRRRDDFFAPWYRRKRRSLWWPGSISAGEIFQDSGVVLLSNGLIPQNLQLIYYRNSPVMYAAMPAPMAAMPDAFAARAFKGHSGDNGRSAKVRVRKYFPETWLWETAFAGQSGSAVFSSKAPDTITSWIISAFAMDPVTGLGIAPSSAKVTVFRPFFIQLALPYSIVRGETVAIQAIVFNYMNKAQEAEVSMENKDGDFDFVIASNDANSIESQSLDVKRKFISIPAQDGVAVSFLITPKKLGYIDIKVAASTATAGDGVQRKLLVKAEGQPQYFNKAILVDLRESARSSVKEKVSLAFPKNAVPGSEKVTVSIIGDIMGSSVNNLEDLLRMPYGCGEQNMLNFVPNIVVLDYLSRTKKLTGTMKAKALTNMEAGYQRELTYKRDDGSFSAFGNNDKSGSTWLTSFVLKSFQQAKQHMTIDESVIETCTQWLVSKQNNEGSFDEPGEVHHKAMQGGSGKGTAALTAFVMIALLQDRVTTRRNYTAQISKGEQYLVRQLRASQSSYEIALITYALHLVDSPAKDSAHQKLLNFAKREKELTWWTEETKKEELGDKQSSHFYLPKSSDIEASAYALLTLEMRNEVDAALPVMRWLITQQGENGGFSSTQDTVIGIQALSAIAGRISSTTVSVDATIRFDEETGRQPVTFRVTGANAQVLQRSEAPPSTRSIEFEASGFGTAVASVSWQYNLAVSAEEPAFFLNPQIGKTSTDNYMQLNVCTYYKAGNSTNMAVMEVALPSGYTADVDALPSISRAKEVKRIDTSDGDTNVIIYFDRITRDELCLTVPAHRNYKVANHKPVPVTLYDYYNRNQAARLFYEPLQALMCDACDGDDCGSTCNIVRTDSKSSESVAGINGSSEAAKVASYSLFAFVVIVCNLVTIHSLF
ncbi:Antigen -like protein [Halotydeus destructor]|nr:Antigen -like protein [Halotydeus destructor]